MVGTPRPRKSPNSRSADGFGSRGVERGPEKAAQETSGRERRKRAEGHFPSFYWAS